MAVAPLGQRRLLRGSSGFSRFAFSRSLARFSIARSSFGVVGTNFGRSLTAELKPINVSCVCRRAVPIHQAPSPKLHTVSPLRLVYAVVFCHGLQHCQS